MLKHRLLFGSFLVVALVALIFADERLSNGWPGGPAYPMLSLGLSPYKGALVGAVLGLLVIAGTRELHRLFTAAGFAPLGVWAACANLVLLVITFAAGNASSDGPAFVSGSDLNATVAWLTVVLIGAAFIIGARGRVQGAIGDLAATMLIVLYLGLLPQYILRVRFLTEEGGAWLLLYFLGTVKVCDIGAYFTGRAIGRHKLIDWLSPKKTVEGLIGGVAASVLVAVGVPRLVALAGAGHSPVATVFPTPAKACIFGLAMALVGQGGDLLESLFKRNAQAKDSANVIPAFGGLLDVLDSPLLAAPVAYWLLLK
jgi:phosphatidate cytidylyltransferase